MESNDLLLTFGDRLVTVIRTLVLQGPADKVFAQLNTSAAFLNEDINERGSVFMGELPRTVELVPDQGLCHTPHFVELDRFADEGNPNHED